jgi:hypothetical protein
LTRHKRNKNITSAEAAPKLENSLRQAAERTERLAKLLPEISMADEINHLARRPLSHLPAPEQRPGNDNTLRYDRKNYAASKTGNKPASENT